MRFESSLILCIAIFASAQAQERPTNTLSAPTYYLAVAAKKCEANRITVRGVTNLPYASMITLQVDEPTHQDAWKKLSEEVYVAVDHAGFFEATITPVQGVRFHRASILSATFATYRPKQTAEVLKIVGKKGENLGDLLQNPQLHQVSGPHLILSAVAVMPGCGG